MWVLMGSHLFLTAACLLLLLAKFPVLAWLSFLRTMICAVQSRVDSNSELPPVMAALVMRVFTCRRVVAVLSS